MAQTTERDLQAAIAEVLTRNGIAFEREVSLSARDRPDFMLDPGLALEVKVKGPVSEVIRQLSRYVESPRVSAVLLVTTRATHIVPDTIEGKTIITICIGGAFL